MSLSKFTPPRVGCQHFKTVVKGIRSEPNTLISGLLDILDNIYGIAKVLKQKEEEEEISIIEEEGIIADLKVVFNEDSKTVYKIIVSDNIPHGFKQILDNGINNPLNMGHIRDGHNNDIESSEFGTGLKKAIIYTSEKTDIYTRSITDDGEENYVKVEFDIPIMIARKEPQESFEPTSFEIIGYKEFNKYSKFQKGSTIILQNLNNSDFSYDHQSCSRFTEHQFEELLIEHLSRAYSDLIRDRVFRVVLNDKPVHIRNDLTDTALIPRSNQMRFTFYIKLNAKNDPMEVQRVGETPTGRIQIKKYNSEQNKFEKISVDDNNDFKNDPNVSKAELISLTTKLTDYDDILNNDYTDIVRGGRCFDPPMKITKHEQDGYSNHIYNRINYDSKRLNKVMGVGPNKIVTRPSNMLISAIHMTMKETTKKFRNFCKYLDYTKLNDDSDSDESTNKKSKKSKADSKTTFKESHQIVTGAATSSNYTTSIPVTAEVPVTSSIVPTSNIVEVYQDASDISSSDLQEESSMPVTENVSLIVTELQEESSIPVTENVSSVELQDDSQSTDLQNETSFDAISESSGKIKEAAKKLMDLIANGNFDRTDGDKVLKYVEEYINSK